MIQQPRVLSMMLNFELPGILWPYQDRDDNGVMLYKLYEQVHVVVRETVEIHGVALLENRVRGPCAVDARTADGEKVATAEDTLHGKHNSVPLHVPIRSHNLV